MSQRLNWTADKDITGYDLPPDYRTLERWIRSIYAMTPNAVLNDMVTDATGIAGSIKRIDTAARRYNWGAKDPSAISASIILGQQDVVVPNIVPIEHPPDFMPNYTKYRDIYDTVGPLNFRTTFPRPIVDDTIITLNDLHVPFQDDAAIAQALTLAHRYNANIAVMSEIMDMFAYSPFIKPMYIPIELEIETTIWLYEKLSKEFDYVVVLTGDNHACRNIKAAARQLQVLGLQHLITVPLTAHLAAPFENIITIFNWWWAVHDVYFCHADTFSSIDARTVRWVQEHFLEWAATYGIRTIPSVIVQAHTHHQALVQRGSTTLIESGCLCHVQPYRLQKPARTSAWIQGVAIVPFEDSVPVIPEIVLRRIGVARPMPPDRQEWLGYGVNAYRRTRI